MSKNRQKQENRQPRLNPQLPVLLKKTAETLRGEGCGSLEVRAALLTMCGVQVEGVSLTSLRISG